MHITIADPSKIVGTFLSAHFDLKQVNLSDLEFLLVTKSFKTDIKCELKKRK